MMYDDSGEFIK